MKYSKCFMQPSLGYPLFKIFEVLTAENIFIDREISILHDY